MFLNREDAGNKLAKALKEYKLKHPLVLGIPRGGVEVGYHVAVELNSDFDIIVIRKLGYPQQPEAAFGALAEDGSLYLDPWSKKYLTKDMIENVIAREKKEIRRRIKTYREGEELPDLKGRTIILVDDGIATGSTVFAAINMCRKLNPRKLIVAAPVSARSQVSKLAVKADEVVVLDKKRNLMAVSQAYKNFANLSDNKVTHFMNQWRQKTGKKISSDH